MNNKTILIVVFLCIFFLSNAQGQTFFDSPISTPSPNATITPSSTYTPAHTFTPAPTKTPTLTNTITPVPIPSVTFSTVYIPVMFSHKSSSSPIPTPSILYIPITIK